jgi:hypothetical protein
MKKSELLAALQAEIGRHDLSTFWKDRVTKTGCSNRRKVFQYQATLIVIQGKTGHVYEVALYSLCDITI